MKNIEAIMNNPLFSGVDKLNIEEMLSCLSAKTSFYKQNEFIFLVGDRISFIGIVLSGKVLVIVEDENGNRNILAEIAPGEMFGEAFVSAGIEKSTVSIQTSEDSEVLLIDYKRIITTCPSNCVYHSKLIENMLAVLAKKILILNQKIEFISKRTTREKLFSYLKTQENIENSNKFTIPFNREQLADYLYVDRSAMSRELCKMRDEGLIKFRKSRFELI